MKIRLDKYLADMGVGTRTEVKRAISKGRVSVDGACVKKPETKIDTEETTVVFDGQIVATQKRIVYPAQARRGDFGNRGCQRKDGDRPDCFPQKKGSVSGRTSG